MHQGRILVIKFTNLFEGFVADQFIFNEGQDHINIYLQRDIGSRTRWIRSVDELSFCSTTSLSILPSIVAAAFKIVGGN